MKTNFTNVLIGAAVVFAVYVYFFRSTAPSYEGFESGPGAIIGMVFAGILGVGILIAFFAGMSEAATQ
jgi:hypothetical protein